jgi:hypothetical protein
MLERELHVLHPVLWLGMDAKIPLAVNARYLQTLGDVARHLLSRRVDARARQFDEVSQPCNCRAPRLQRTRRDSNPHFPIGKNVCAALYTTNPCSSNIGCSRE